MTRHPEETCERCGGPNVWSWSVDSDRWNAATAGSERGAGSIWCPPCFTVAHEKATDLRTTWRLVPEGFFQVDA